MRSRTFAKMLALGVVVSATLVQQSWAQVARSTQSSDRAFSRMHSGSALLGRDIYSSDGERVGKLDNIVVDLETGRVLYAIVSVGGGLIGRSDRLALPPGVFAKGGDDRRINLRVARSALQGAPAFTSSMENAREFASGQYVNSVYKHFGQSAWWEGASGANAGHFNNTHGIRQLPGTDVRNVMDQKIGDVDSVLVDLVAGRVGYVILAPDREMRFDQDHFAMPPDMFTLNKDGKSLTADITREKLASAPRFQKGSLPNFNDPQMISRVYTFYGKRPYTEGMGLQPTGQEQERIYRDSNSDNTRSEVERLREELRRERERSQQRDTYDRNRDERWDNGSGAL